MSHKKHHNARDVSPAPPTRGPKPIKPAETGADARKKPAHAPDPTPAPPAPAVPVKRDSEISQPGTQPAPQAPAPVPDPVPVPASPLEHVTPAPEPPVGPNDNNGVPHRIPAGVPAN